MGFKSIPQKSNSGITKAREFLDKGLDGILIGPKDAEGISGFLFDIPDTDQVTLSSDITDHYTENNSFLNDHIVRKPIIVSTSGFIGELVYRRPSGVAGAIQELNNRLETVEAYAGEFTPGAIQTAQRAVQQAQSAVSAVNQTLDKTQNIIAAFDGESYERTEQQKAFSTLNALWLSQESLYVLTPWGYFSSMVIQSIIVSQNGDSESISDFQVTLKEIRVAQTKTTSYDENIFPVREEVQAGEEEDQGIIRGTGRESSFLFQAFGS